MISLITPSIPTDVSVPQPDDAFLLRQVGCSCERSFNALFSKYWEKAYSDAFKRLKDADLAKDVVQEVFMHIWEKRETSHILNLPAYLNVAVRNKVFKQVEKQTLHNPFFEELENIPSKHSNADENLLWKEFFDSYEVLVKSLPASRQTIFRLHYQEDLSTKAIAAELGISRKTVQNQLGKVMKKLKVSLLPLLPLLLFFLKLESIPFI
nr:sigma-70 family RNA polymerase sigma factor [uncultured Mucilaginibacter sp.]